MFTRTNNMLVVLAAGLLVFAVSLAVHAEDADAPPRDEKRRATKQMPPEDYDNRERSYRKQSGDRPSRGSKQGKDDDGEKSSRSRFHGMTLSEEDQAEALIIIQEYNPELAERIERWREEGRENVAMLIGKRLPWVRRLIFMKRHDPDRYALTIRDMQLEREAHELSRRMGETKGDEQAQAKNKLREALSEQFNVRQKIREMEIGLMQKRLQELNEQLRERASAKDKLINDRLSELAGDKTSAPW